MSLTRPQRQNYDSNQSYADITNLYRMIEELMGQVTELQAKLGLAQQSSNGIGGIARAISIPAANDPNARAQVFGAGINPLVTNVSLASSISGLLVGTGPSYNLSISSAASFRSVIGVSAAATMTAGTYTVGARLTPAGVDGKITVDAGGRVTAVIQATLL